MRMVAARTKGIITADYHCSGYCLVCVNCQLKMDTKTVFAYVLVVNAQTAANFAFYYHISSNVVQ
jgi:hypothetical protein